MTTISCDATIEAVDGSMTSLADHRDDVMLVVNVASRLRTDPAIRAAGVPV
jgi:glutathione peroxidase-family protein